MKRSIFTGYLLLAGADPYQICVWQNSEGTKIEKTPFALALEKGNANIINIFAKYGFVCL